MSNLQEAVKVWCSACDADFDEEQEGCHLGEEVDFCADCVTDAKKEFGYE